MNLLFERTSLLAILPRLNHALVDSVLVDMDTIANQLVPGMHSLCRGLGLGAGKSALWRRARYEGINQD